jgi:hypothetical protein
MAQTNVQHNAWRRSIAPPGGAKRVVGLRAKVFEFAGLYQSATSARPGLLREYLSEIAVDAAPSSIADWRKRMGIEPTGPRVDATAQTVLKTVKGP